MCGRYYVDDETAREIEKIVRQVDGRLKGIKTGDVYPTQTALVLAGKQPQLTPERMQWGFPQAYPGRKGLLINARAETALEKRAFRDSILHRRCIIPAKRFYEWDASKNKVAFLHPDGKLLYMAGFYQKCGEGERFVILTTQANASVEAVHGRMPLILEAGELEDWVFDGKYFEAALRKMPPMLQKYQEYEQQRLF